ncbi:hypothetical protein NCLIV_009210 [Neospora caninum Liverpool]|uniref:MI domain-containing protein n=1 Tax=Neospora caninum (strain Liverpool) TaxID=572307 RepID=F0V9M6_NEOCL|nr:hypothetical protein NCLIV_009210 [Neospora caninum Liverpool]CBZ50452.1 hypothetical protein NCLIV_009210 [Neospora caninum Liverpool]|eukprot:XP_003880485.1 hypothetical protein NCLIV_009210 [Neospora caninum Liverpool]
MSFFDVNGGAGGRSPQVGDRRGEMAPPSHADNQSGGLPPPLLSSAFSSHGHPLRPNHARSDYPVSEPRPSGEETGTNNAPGNAAFPRACLPGPSLAASQANGAEGRDPGAHDEARSGGPTAGPFGFHLGPLPSSLCGPPPPSPPPPGSVCVRPQHVGGGGESSRGGPRERLPDGSLHAGRAHQSSHGPVPPTGEVDGNRLVGGAGMGPGTGPPNRGVGGGGVGRGGTFEEHAGGRGGAGRGGPLGGVAPAAEGLGREEGPFPDRDAPRPENGPPHPRKLRGPHMNSGGGRGHGGVDFPGGGPGPVQHGGPQDLQGGLEPPRGPHLPGDVQMMGPPLHPPFHHHGRDGPSPGLGSDMGGAGMRFVMGHHSGGVPILPGPGGPLRGGPQVGPGGGPSGAPFGQAPTASGAEPMLGCGPNLSMPSQMMMPQGSPPGGMQSPVDVHPGGMRMGGPQPVVGVPGPVVCGVGPLGSPPGAGGGTGPGLGLQGPPGMPGVGGQGLRGPPGNNAGPLLGVGMVAPLVGVGPHVVGGGMGSTTPLVNPPPPRRRNVLDIRDPRTGKLVIGGSLLDGAGFLAEKKETPGDDKEKGGSAQKQKEGQPGKKEEKRAWSGPPRQGDGEKLGDGSGPKDASGAKAKGGDSSETVPKPAVVVDAPGPAAKSKEAAPASSPRAEESRPSDEKDSERKKEEGTPSESRADGSQRRRGSSHPAGAGQGEGGWGAQRTPVSPGEASKQEAVLGHKEKEGAASCAGSAEPAEGRHDSRRSPSGGSGKEDTFKTVYGGSTNKRERRKSQNACASPASSPSQTQHNLAAPTNRSRSSAANARRDAAHGQEAGLGDHGVGGSAPEAAPVKGEDSASNGVKHAAVEAPPTAAETPGLTVGSVVLGSALKRNSPYEEPGSGPAAARSAGTSGPVWSGERQEGGMPAGSACGDVQTGGAPQQSRGKGRRASSLPEEEDPSGNRHPGFAPKRGSNAVPPPPPGGLPASRRGNGGSASHAAGRDGSAPFLYSENEPSLASNPPTGQQAEYGVFSRSSSTGLPEGKNSPLRSGSAVLSPSFSSALGSAGGRHSGFKAPGDERSIKNSPPSSRDGRGKEGSTHAPNQLKRPGGRADRGVGPAASQYGHGRSGGSLGGHAGEDERGASGFVKGEKLYGYAQVPPSPTGGPGDKAEAVLRDEVELHSGQGGERFGPERSDRNAGTRQGPLKNGEGRQRRGSFGERGDQKGAVDRGSVRGGNGPDRGGERGGTAMAGFGGVGGNKNSAGRGWRAAGKAQGRDSSPLTSSEAHTPQFSASSCLTSGPAATPGPRGVWGPNGRAAGGALMRAHAHAGRGGGTLGASPQKTPQPEKSLHGNPPGVPASPVNNAQNQAPKTPVTPGETGAERESSFPGNPGREEDPRRGNTQRPGALPVAAANKGSGEGDGDDGAPGMGREGREGPRGKEALRQRDTTPLHKNNGLPSQGPTPRSGGRGQEGGRGRGDRQVGGPKMGNNVNGGERGVHAASPSEGKMPMPAHASPGLGGRGGPSLVSGPPGPCGEREGRDTFSSDFASSQEGRRGEKEGTPPVCCPHPPTGPVPPHLLPAYDGSGRFVPRPHMVPALSASGSSERETKGANAPFNAGPPIVTGPAGALLQGTGGSAPPFGGSSFVPYKACPPAHSPLLYPAAGVSNVCPQQDPHSPPPFAAFPPSYPGGSAPPHGLGGPPLPEGSHGMRMFPPQGPFPQQGVVGLGPGIEGPGRTEFPMDGCSAGQKTGSVPGGILPPDHTAAGNAGFSGGPSPPGEGETPADGPYTVGVSGNNGAIPLVPSTDLSGAANMPAPATSPYYFYPPGAGSEVSLEGAPPAGPVPLDVMHHVSSHQLPFLGQPSPQQVNCMQLNSAESCANANYGAERESAHAPGEMRNGAPLAATPASKGGEAGGVMEGEGPHHPMGPFPPQSSFALGGGAAVPFGYPPPGNTTNSAGRDASPGNPQSGAGVYGQSPVMGVHTHHPPTAPPSEFGMSSRNSNPNLLTNHSGPHPHMPFPSSSPASSFPPRGLNPEVGAGLPHPGSTPGVAPGSSLGPSPHRLQPSLPPPGGIGMGVQGFTPSGSQPAKPGMSPPLGAEGSPGYLDGTGAAGSARGPFAPQGPGPQTMRGSATSSPRKFQGNQGPQAAESSSDRRRNHNRRIENQPLKRRGDESPSRPSSVNGRLRAGGACAPQGGFMARHQSGGQGSSTASPAGHPPLLCSAGAASNLGTVFGAGVDASLGETYSQPGASAGPAPFLGSGPGGLPGCPPPPVYGAPSPFVPAYGAMGMGRGVAAPAAFGGPGAQPGLQRVPPGEGASCPATPVAGPQQGGGRGMVQGARGPQSPGAAAGHGVCQAGSPQRRVRKVANVPMADARRRRGSPSSWTESSRVESEASADFGESAVQPSTAVPAGMAASPFAGKQPIAQTALGSSARGPKEDASAVSGQDVAVSAEPCLARPSTAATGPPLLAAPGKGQETRRVEERTSETKPAHKDQRDEGRLSPPSGVDSAASPSGVSSSSPALATAQEETGEDEAAEGKGEAMEEGGTPSEAPAEASAESEAAASDAKEVPAAALGSAYPCEEQGREKRSEQDGTHGATEAEEDGTAGASSPASQAISSPSEDAKAEAAVDISGLPPGKSEETRKDETEEGKREQHDGDCVRRTEGDTGEEGAKETAEDPVAEGASRGPLLAPALRGEGSCKEPERTEETRDVAASAEENRDGDEPRAATGVAGGKPATQGLLVPAGDEAQGDALEAEEAGKTELRAPADARAGKGAAAEDAQEDAESRPSCVASRDARQTRPSLAEDRPFFERARGSSAGLVGAPPALSPSASQRDASGPSLLGRDLSPSVSVAKRAAAASHAAPFASQLYDKKLLVGLFLALHGTFSPPEFLGRIRCVSPGEAQLGGASKRSAASKDWPASKTHKQGGSAGNVKSKLGNAGSDRSSAANAHVASSPASASLPGSLFGKGGAQAGKGGLMGRGGGRGAGTSGEWPHLAGGENFDRAGPGGVVERSGSTCSSGGWRDSPAGSKWREESAALARQNNASQGGIFGAGGTPAGNPRGHQGSMTDSFSRLGGFFSSRPGQSGGSLHGASMQSVSRGPEFLLKKQTLDRPQRLRRSINSLLNKMSIDKFAVVTEKIAVEGESLENAEELQMLADLVYAKAVTEPEYSEMYADLCQILKWRSLEFEKEGEEKNLNFNRAFVNRCQEEFEALQGRLALEVTEEERALCHSEEDVQKLSKKKKNRVLGNMRFIGELYLRKCIAPSVLKAVVTSLVFGDSGDPDFYPDEHFIECFTELLTTIGFTLDKQPHTQQMLHEFMGKLQDLQQKANYSKRIVYKIQDLLDLRARNWTKKVFREKAKSVAQIREDAMRDELMGGAIHMAQAGTYTVVGLRNTVHYSYYLQEQRTIFEKKKAAKKAADAAGGAGGSGASSWPSAPLPAGPASAEPPPAFGASSPSSDSLVPSPPGKPGPPPYAVGAQGLGTAGALGATPVGPFPGPGCCLPAAHGLGGPGGKGAGSAPPLLGGAPPAFQPVSGPHGHARFGPAGPSGGAGGGKGLVGARGSGGPGLMNVGAEAPEAPPPEPCEPPELKKDVEILCFEFVREEKPFAEFWQEWKALKMPNSTSREQFHALCAKASDDSHPERSARYADLLGHILCEQVRMSASLRQFVDVINVNFLPQLEDMALDNPRVTALFAVIIATMVTSPNFTKRQEGCMPSLEIPASEDVAWEFLQATYEEVKKRVGGENEAKLAFVKSLTEASLRRKFPNQPDFVAKKLASLG